MKQRVLVFFIFFTATVFLSAQQAPSSASGWSVTASPAFFMPVFSGNFEKNELFAPSWGGAVSAEYCLASGFPLSLLAGVNYSVASLLPVGDITMDGALKELIILAGIASGVEIAPRLGFRSFFNGGVILGQLDAGTAVAYGAVQAGIGLGVGFTDSLTARLETAAMYKFGLAAGIGTTLGVNYRLPVFSGTAKSLTPFLDFSRTGINNIFPVLKSQYDDNTLGTVIITNNGKHTAEDVQISFNVKQYMDVPKHCLTIERLKPGQSAEVQLFALFNDSILDVTEATKVSCQITASYNGIEQTQAVTVTVYDRNALIWTDDRMAAAFVSSKDPWVLDLTGNIMASTMTARNPELPGNLQTAIAVHEGLRTYGVSYMLSPSRPFGKDSTDLSAVDSLKFPRQTLGFRAGDCADLSVLYASCFESAGIETAFVTVPGHIFIAADLGLTPEQAELRGLRLEDYIINENKVWLPIETTMRNAGFSEVRQKAAEQWRDAYKANLAAVYPVHEAWAVYPPVGLPADGSTVVLPDSFAILKNFRTELASAVNTELNARLSGLGQAPSRGAALARYSNDRGVLYAKYGFYNDARSSFLKAVQAGSVSALVNLGNIAMFESDADSAYKYYQQATKELPRNTRLKVNLAKAAMALGRADEAAAAMEEVRKTDPLLADEYSDIAAAASASGTRAGRLGNSGVLWF